MTIVDLPTARGVRDGWRARRAHQRRIGNSLSVTRLNDVIGKAHGYALQIDGGRHDEAAFYIAIQIVNDTNLLHVGSEVVIHRAEAFLQRNAGSDGGREDNGAETDANQHFTQGEAGDIL